MKIFYIYFGDHRFVPIHVSEIIGEFLKRGHEIHVFTRVSEQELKRLQMFAYQVESLIELRLSSQRLEQASKAKEQAEKALDAILKVKGE